MIWWLAFPNNLRSVRMDVWTEMKVDWPGVGNCWSWMMDTWGFVALFSHFRIISLIFSIIRVVFNDWQLRSITYKYINDCFHQSSWISRIFLSSSWPQNTLTYLPSWNGGQLGFSFLLVFVFYELQALQQRLCFTHIWLSCTWHTARYKLGSHVCVCLNDWKNLSGLDLSVNTPLQERSL